MVLFRDNSSSFYPFADICYYTNNNASCFIKRDYVQKKNIKELNLNENNNEVIKVMVEHACQKVSSWGDGYDSDKHNRVQVVNVTTRKRCSFDYWGSIMEPNQESADGVLGAITCYASDASAYTSSRDFFDFCRS